MQRSMGGSCRDMIKCLLARDPQKRYGCLARGCKDIKSAPYFAKIDWQKLLLKEMKAPYVPKINAKVGISNDNFEPLMVNTDISTYKGKQGNEACTSCSTGDYEVRGVMLNIWSSKSSES